MCKTHKELLFTNSQNTKSVCFCGVCNLSSNSSKNLVYSDYTDNSNDYDELNGFRFGFKQDKTDDNSDILAQTNNLMLELLKQRVTAKLFELLEVYRNSSMRSKVLFKDPIINFNIKSAKIAGQARYPTELRFNLYYLEEQQDHYINEVVGHELAHFLVFHHISTGEYKGKIQPHGKQ